MEVFSATDFYANFLAMWQESNGRAAFVLSIVCEGENGGGILLLGNVYLTVELSCPLSHHHTTPPLSLSQLSWKKRFTILSINIYGKQYLCSNTISIGSLFLPSLILYEVPANRKLAQLLRGNSFPQQLLIGLQKIIFHVKETINYAKSNCSCDDKYTLFVMKLYFF